MWIKRKRVTRSMDKRVTILEKINSAQTKKELDLLMIEIVLSPGHAENMKAYVAKKMEMDKQGS